MESPRLSVIVPVYNEGEAVRPLVSDLTREAGFIAHEILIVFDRESDTTAPVARSLAQTYPSIRPILNDIGPGPANALRKGFLEAKGEACLVLMGDASDDFGSIRPMWEAFDKGAVLVSASRHCPGGQRRGGPWIKGKLSYLAGLILHRIVGIPTADPTNNFKLYARRFLLSVPIESKTGFEIALELTVKAHQQGLPMAEIPTVWKDRLVGQSNFRMLKWMPLYLRWFFLAFRRRPV